MPIKIIKIGQLLSLICLDIGYIKSKKKDLGILRVKTNIDLENPPQENDLQMVDAH
jgi:hypothetical protein